MDQEGILTRARLKTPRAAAVAGIVFSVLLITREAAQVMDSFIIVDMMAKVCRGVPIDDSIKWAVDEMKKIYNK
jgi:hypothetical protein